MRVVELVLRKVSKYLGACHQNILKGYFHVLDVTCERRGIAVSFFFMCPYKCNCSVLLTPPIKITDAIFRQAFYPRWRSLSFSLAISWPLLTQQQLRNRFGVLEGSLACLQREMNQNHILYERFNQKARLSVLFSPKALLVKAFHKSMHLLKHISCTCSTKSKASNVKSFPSCGSRLQGRSWPGVRLAGQEMTTETCCISVTRLCPPGALCYTAGPNRTKRPGQCHLLRLVSGAALTDRSRQRCLGPAWSRCVA